MRHGPRRRTLVYAGGLAALGLLSAPAARAGLEELIVAAKPSVVAVGVYNPTGNPRFGFRGSGFVVGDGNFVVTNLHVLPDVIPPGGAEGSLAVVAPRLGSADSAGGRGAKVVATDREHDLALLRIDGAPLPALQLAEAGAREGTSIALIGFPIGGVLGFSPVTHRGIVASVTTIALPAPSSQSLSNQAINRLRQGTFEVYQLDATAYPGNSGGPVLDLASGEVVAVLNMVLVKGSRETALSQPTGISYAIPVRFVSELLKNR
ncbi:MAG: trypsin-like peptidase domain-containing protein [Rubrivivax sp.]|nr:trypsin-like peptidase domain-containing protein [Rubrivivax sp.]